MLSFPENMITLVHESVPAIHPRWIQVECVNSDLFSSVRQPKGSLRVRLLIDFKTVAVAICLIIIRIDRSNSSIAE
jgi:hypothetical protein